MHNGIENVERPSNEVVLEFRPQSWERKELEKALERARARQEEIPLVIDGKRISTAVKGTCRIPHEHHTSLASYCEAQTSDYEKAIEGALRARRSWAEIDWHDRALIFLRAAELAAGPWRQRLNAATMLNQSKTCHQAEIDSACELIDFFRFNVAFQHELYQSQPRSLPGVRNRLEYRCLDGFVVAITPFNFTSIAANLPCAPALMGNAVIWKPASTAVYSAYEIFLLLEEAGLPPGVIQFMPGRGSTVEQSVLTHPHFAGLHFTGSTETFDRIHHVVSENLNRYISYPRLVGETGGKNFIVAHPSADAAALQCAIVRGAYEYQGQKCSAASRLYVAESVWRKIKGDLADTIRSLQVGDPTDFRHFLGAVIDEAAFLRIGGYLEKVPHDSSVSFVVEGARHREEGYFIGPTLVQTQNPQHRLMQEEIFGPVACITVYPDSAYSDMLTTIDTTSPYALTGAVFATERKAIGEACTRLRHAAGNFYINTKPTGAVVGQQPFGGSRRSGTNDKAGSGLNLLRWVSGRTVCEVLAPPTDYRYPYLES